MGFGDFQINAIRLHRPACCVHQGRSSTHQFGTRTHGITVSGLRLRAAMPPAQQLRIDSRQPCQCPRVVSIVFRLLFRINCTFARAPRLLCIPAPLTAG